MQRTSLGLGWLKSVRGLRTQEIITTHICIRAPSGGFYFLFAFVIAHPDWCLPVFSITWPAASSSFSPELCLKTKCDHFFHCLLQGLHSSTKRSCLCVLKVSRGPGFFSWLCFLFFSPCVLCSVRIFPFLTTLPHRPTWKPSVHSPSLTLKVLFSMRFPQPPVWESGADQPCL